MKKLFVFLFMIVSLNSIAQQDVIDLMIEYESQCYDTIVFENKVYKQHSLYFIGDTAYCSESGEYRMELTEKGYTYLKKTEPTFEGFIKYLKQKQNPKNKIQKLKNGRKCNEDTKFKRYKYISR